MPKGKGYGALPVGSESARKMLASAYRPKKTPKKTPNQQKGGGMTKSEAMTASYESTQKPFTSSQTGQSVVKRSMLFNNMIESGNFRADTTLSDYDRALQRNLQKYNIRPTRGKFKMDTRFAGGNEGVGSPRARQKLIMMLYPKGLK